MHAVIWGERLHRVCWPSSAGQNFRRIVVRGHLFSAEVLQSATGQCSIGLQLEGGTSRMERTGVRDRYLGELGSTWAAVANAQQDPHAHWFFTELITP